jgi:hypothetical protein
MTSPLQPTVLPPSCSQPRDEPGYVVREFGNLMGFVQAGTSSSDTNDKGQRPVKLKYLFVVDVSDVLTDSFYGNCHDFIDHDL